jgi:hypothetical protein
MVESVRIILTLFEEIEMSLKKTVLALVFIFVGQAAAQQPDSGAWFMSPSPFGASLDEQFQVETMPEGNLIAWAPPGKTPVSWGSITLQSNGSIEFHAGDPTALCVLQRIDERNYDGTCKGFGPNDRQVTLTRNDPPSGMELTVSDTDFLILAKARQILSSASVWNRHDDGYCEDDAKQNSWSLFCALYQASIDVTGTYLQLRPVMMDVRGAVGQNKKDNVPRPGKFLAVNNNLESMTYADIATIFDDAEKRLQAKTTCLKAFDWKTFADHFPPQNYVVPTSGEYGLFGEGLAAYTMQKKTYNVFVTADPMATIGKPPNAWLAASTAVTATPHNGSRGYDGVNVTGKLRNGNLWRSFGQCGQSLRYYDVPPEAAAALDRMIDGVYAPDRK